MTYLENTASGRFHPATSKVLAVIAHIRTAQRRAKLRRQLLMLDERLLHDIGLCRSDIAADTF